MNRVSLEHRHRETISGRRRGLTTAITRAFLRGLSFFYGGAIALRNLWYRAPLASRRAGAAVISVGNITTGGTGKTPMTAWVAAMLIREGRRPGILMRGYRAKPAARATIGATRRMLSDEAELLRRHCPAARMIVDPDRVRGAGRAIREGCNALVLDDGFQHRRLRRDLDIVLMDATCPFGLGFLLPRGLMREPKSALRRASVIVVTRCDQIDAADLERLLGEIQQAAPRVPVLRGRHAVTAFTDLHGRVVQDVDVAAMRAAAFAGIANFASFGRTLRGLGITLIAEREFADHHDYSDAQIAALPQWAMNMEANVLLTTEKDAVKLADRWPAESPRVLAPRVEITLEADGAEVLREMIRAVVRPKPAAK